MACICSRIQVGTKLTEHRNLNPDCPVHGEKSEWYNSPEQVQIRKKRSDRLRALYQARAEAMSCVEKEEWS